MRTIPTGRGGAKGNTGLQGPQGVSGLTAKLAQVITNGHAAADLTGWYSSGAAVPVAFSTLVYLDTTAVTGGLYIWSGTAYIKVAT